MDERKPCNCETVAHYGTEGVTHKACMPCPQSRITGCVPAICPVNEPDKHHEAWLR